MPRHSVLEGLTLLTLHTTVHHHPQQGRKLPQLVDPVANDRGRAHQQGRRCYTLTLPLVEQQGDGLDRFA